MSHNIEVRGNQASVFSTGKTWHGLGKVYDINNPPKTAQEAMEACGADYEVELKPLFCNIGKTKDNDRVASFLDDEGEENLIEVPGRFGVIRNTDNKVLGTVGTKYRVLQNSEAFNFFNPFIRDGQASFEAGGVLSGGSKIWSLVKINEGASGEVVNGDLVHTYLLLFNSHDGSTSVGVLFTPVRVVCQNTLTMAIEGSGTNMIKVSHTENMEKSLSLVQQTIDISRKSFTVTLEQYRCMQEKNLSIEGLAQYASRAILQDNERVDMKDLKRVVKNVMTFHDEGIGQNIDGVQGTVWGAYNAVTGFVDHVRGRSDETRLEASWFGEGKKVRERAHSLALDLVAGKN